MAVYLDPRNLRVWEAILIVKDEQIETVAQIFETQMLVIQNGLKKNLIELS